MTSADLWSNIIKDQPSASRKGINSMLILIAYELWSEQNRKFFQSKIRPVIKDIEVTLHSPINSIKYEHKPPNSKL
jgi:hypothetical protein